MTLTKITIDGTEYELKAVPADKPIKYMFTTQDGKGVFERDTFPVYKVDKHSFEILQLAACDCANWPDYKYFYSKEKAEEYILVNKPKEIKERKPVLTSADGRDIFEGDYFWWVCNWDAVKIIATKDSPVSYTGKRIYSTEMTANNYILWHKYSMSMNDIYDLVNMATIKSGTFDYTYFIDNMFNLAKSRIK